MAMLKAISNKSMLDKVIKKHAKLYKNELEPHTHK